MYSMAIFGTKSPPQFWRTSPVSSSASDAGRAVSRSGRPPRALIRARGAGWAVLIWFVAVEPAGPWDTFVKRLDAEVEATGLGAVLWCSPFVGTVPGTDTYMDELWLSSAPNPSSPSASCE
jgi:hypothetical protein